ncbi:MAG: NADP-dependent oxidoreductase [Gordonia sp. (in: high G+C Gram-positive bacteria)]|jgi:NADPH:quinone reductase-like Zn-dependent oxidoreductase|nr:NADP-dependent oxidoreductase [Gordonia sp. (in: high G+C Gram-positive bacteria)]
MTGRRWQCNGPDGLADFEFVQVEAEMPGQDEMRVEVRAAGVNPADLKHTRRATAYPVPVGYEVAGVVTDVGSTAAERFAPGDRVVAFRVHGGYATELTFPAEKAFALPDSVDDVTAAGLLLAGTTAADMLHRSGASDGDTILVHGASGAVGATLLQLSARRGVRVVGTAGAMRFDAVRRFGGVPVAYGPGLIDRLHGWTFDAALDLAGTDEATDASLALVADRSRIITAANKPAADEYGFVAVAGMDPESTAFRDAMRPELISMLAAGDLEVTVAQTFPLAQALDALELVASGAAGGKVVLTV